MSRAPLTAWRRLFAIGGAPAASHLVLSRAPSAERLLEPLAGVRVVSADRLESLARPLDIGTALARVTTSVTETRSAPAAEDNKRTRTPRAAEVARDVRAARAPSSSSASETREHNMPPLAHSNSEAAPVRRAPGWLPTGQPAAATSSRLVPEVIAPSDVRKKRVARFAEQPARTKVALPTSTNDAGPSATRLAHESSAAASGANTRVLVTSAVAEIDRLLAVASATPNLSPASAPRTSAPAAETRAADARDRDVSTLLTSAVERARSAIAATSVQVPPESRTIAAPSFATSGEPVRNSLVSSTAADVGGGFRGLAQRTLTTTRSARVATQRIEPEKHTSSDLALDTLDARVADSLARVLEREARRHGIDLAEARA